MKFPLSAQGSLNRISNFGVQKRLVIAAILVFIIVVSNLVLVALPWYWITYQVGLQDDTGSDTDRWMYWWWTGVEFHEEGRPDSHFFFTWDEYAVNLTNTIINYTSSNSNDVGQTCEEEAAQISLKLNNIKYLFIGTLSQLCVSTASALLLLISLPWFIFPYCNSQIPLHRNRFCFMFKMELKTLLVVLSIWINIIMLMECMIFLDIPNALHYDFERAIKVKNETSSLGGQCAALDSLDGTQFCGLLLSPLYEFFQVSSLGPCESFSGSAGGGYIYWGPAAGWLMSIIIWPAGLLVTVLLLSARRIPGTTIDFDRQVEEDVQKRNKEGDLGSINRAKRTEEEKKGKETDKLLRAS